MINRCAVIVRPKQPYIDWATGLDDSSMVPTDDDEQTVYLIPEYDVEGMAQLSEACEIIFDSELEDWHLIIEDWPANRTFAMFREWFEIETRTPSRREGVICAAVIQSMHALPTGSLKEEGRTR